MTRKEKMSRLNQLVTEYTDFMYPENMDELSEDEGRRLAERGRGRAVQITEMVIDLGLHQRRS